MNKRIPLSQRRTDDQKGVDAIFEPTAPAPRDEEPKEKLVKATYYIRPEHVIALERIQLAERQRLGKRRDKSDLIQEAIGLLIARYEGPAA